MGGKLIATAHQKEKQLFVTFKASEIGYEVMREMEGLRPAPYLASRGMKWIQQYGLPGLSDDDLKAHIALSYDMAVERLTRKKRSEIGL